MTPRQKITALKATATLLSCLFLSHVCNSIQELSKETEARHRLEDAQAHARGLELDRRYAEEQAAKAQQKEVERKAQAMVRDAMIARLGRASPQERAAELRRCLKANGCSDDIDPQVVISAAANSSERQRLQSTIERAEKARRHASSPLLCCDGSFSPSCYCSGPHRGCCSHHGGVCACSE
jgi:hypothetical protein